ncbi:MAG: tetratricopeptide repeat protein [Tannerellaceae bacterium]|jgi:tetratricopeptide (TPR) repeat protein|nr:tetratricopeptide repeat protein [Tannerellaceae bacterium]
MVLQQHIRHSFEYITELLDKMELQRAFEAIREQLAYANSPALSEKLESLSETYRTMLGYFIEGVQDPMQSLIYKDVLASTYELADVLRLHIISNNDGAPMYFVFRKQWRSIPGVSINTLLQQLIVMHTNPKDIEETVFMLFNKLWLSDPFEQEDFSSLADVLSDEQVPYVAGCQIISALILSLMSYFDVRKLMLLLEAFSNGGNEEIKARAITGALIIIYMYRARIHAYPQIADSLASLAESPGFTQKLRIITLRFILAKETEKISNKLQNEILPAMLKIVPNIISRDTAEFDPEKFAEMNPEWKSLFANKDLERSLEEYNQLQSEGADVMHSTFAYLKNFDFFREIGNWFLPFMPNHSRFNHFISDDAKQTIVDLTTALAFLCNSDKYSFAFSMMRQSQSDRLQILGQFHEHTQDIMEQYKREVVGDTGLFELIVGQYIQDLYRFFKLYTFHKDFSDIFEWKLDFYNLPVFREYLSDSESLSIFAEYHLKKNHFDEALALFEYLSSVNPNNDMLLQKIGYCHQMEGRTAEALEVYLRADLINTQSKWLTRRIGACFRAVGQPGKAIEFYRRLESWSPNSLSVQLGIGHCLLEQGEYDEALKYYFKVDYLDATGLRARRPLAWCLFLAKRYDDALGYYRKILEDENKPPETEDYINAGHTAWAARRLSQAVDYYKAATLTSFEQDFSFFLNQFNKDIPKLLAAGISAGEIPLVLDQLRFVLASIISRQ